MQEAENWWDDPEVRAAFVTWREVQSELATLQNREIPANLSELDARLREAQRRALEAWHLYEMQRENAGGPLAGPHLRPEQDPLDVGRRPLDRMSS